MEDYVFTTTAVLGPKRAILRRDKDGAIFVSQEISLGSVAPAQKQAILSLFRLLPMIPSFSFWRVLYVSYDDSADTLLTLSRGTPLTSLASLYFEAVAAYTIYSERELSVICAQLIDCFVELCRPDLVKIATAAKMRPHLDPSCFWFDDHGLLKCDLVHMLSSRRLASYSTESSWASDFVAALGKTLYLFVTVEVPAVQAPPTQYFSEYIKTVQCFTIPFASKYSRRFSKQFIDFVNRLNHPSNLLKLTASSLQKSSVYLFGKSILNDIIGVKTDCSGNSLLHKAALECSGLEAKALSSSLAYLCRLRNTSGETALQLAIKHGNLELAKLLIDEEAGSYSDTKESAVELALLRGSCEVARLLIPFEGKILTERGYTQLMLAASFGERRLVEKYIQRQAKRQAKNGVTAMHLAVISAISLHKSIKLLLQERDRLATDSGHLIVEAEVPLTHSSVTPRNTRSPRSISILTKSCGRGDLFAQTAEKESAYSRPRVTSSRRPITSVRYPRQTPALSASTRVGTPKSSFSSRGGQQISPSITVPSMLSSSPRKRSGRCAASRSGSSKTFPMVRPRTTQITAQKLPAEVTKHRAQSTYGTQLDGSIKVPVLQFDNLSGKHVSFPDALRIKDDASVVECRIRKLRSLFQAFVEIILLLIPLEKQISQRNGLTALMIAAKADVVELVRLLVNDEKLMVDARGETALMIAVRNNAAAAVKELLTHEATRASANREHYTALHLAVQTNNSILVEQLATLENNIPQACYTLKDFPNSRNAHALINVTALMMASIGNAPECALILSRYEAGRHEQLFGYTALMLAAYFNHSAIVELLLHSESRETMHNGWTALMVASSRGNLRCCAKLATCESKLTAQGLTALMLACKHNFLNIVTLLYPLESSIYHKRVRNGVVERWSCLTYAAAKGSTEVVMFLLEHHPSREDIRLAVSCSHNPKISILLSAYH